MTTQRRILLEGYTPEEIPRLSDEELRAFVFADEPLVFQAGSAQVLGQFQHLYFFREHVEVVRRRFLRRLAELPANPDATLRVSA